MFTKPQYFSGSLRGYTSSNRLRGTTMKILHAIQSADPTCGGPLEGILQIVQATTASISHEIVSIDSPSADFLADLPCPWAALGPGSLLGYSPRLVPWLRTHASQFDLVIVHGLWRYISLGTWRALHGGSTPYVVMPHGMLDPWFKRQYPLKHVKKWLFWPWTEYRVLRDASAVIFTCDEERRLARDSFWLYQCNERVGTVGIRGPDADIESARNRFYDAYPALRGKRLILFLGRLHEKKGCDILVESFARVACHDADLRLVMAGPCHDNLDQKLRTLAANRGIANRVIWTGMITGDMKWGALATAEAFALPSHQENFGIAVAEALSCSTPVLISNKVQIWREIDQDQGGLICDDTIESTTAMLRQWLDMEPDKRGVMRAAARRCFERRYEAKHFAKVMMRLYKEAAAPA